MEGRRFPCGAIFVSRRAEDELSYKGPTLQDALTEYVRVRWERPPLGDKGKDNSYDGSIVAWAWLGYGGHCRLRAYRDPLRTFTCLSGNREAPFARRTLDGEPRLGRPVRVLLRALHRAMREARVSGWDLARRSGLREALVYRLDDARRPEDSWADLHHVQLLARALGVPPTALFEPCRHTGSLSALPREGST